MDPVTLLLMQSASGPLPATQDMSDSDEDIMPVRARAMEVDDDGEDAEDARGGGSGGRDFESEESDSDAVSDGDDDDDDDDSDEEDSGAETDMDASDEEEEEDDSDDSDDDDDEDEDEDDDDDSADDKKKKQASKRKKNVKKPAGLDAVVPSLKFLKRKLKSVKLFMEVVDAYMRKHSCTLYKAVDDVKKQPDAEDLYKDICLLNSKVAVFTRQVADKLEADDRPHLVIAARKLMNECVVLVDPQYAPELFVGATDKPCAVSGKNTTMRLAVFKDTFKTYIEERTAAKERGDPKPDYKNDAVPKKLAIPVIPGAAPLLVQMVVAGSLHQLYNPALKRINLNVYAAAAHDAMLDIARFV